MVIKSLISIDFLWITQSIQWPPRSPSKDISKARIHVQSLGKFGRHGCALLWDHSQRNGSVYKMAKTLQVWSIKESCRVFPITLAASFSCLLCVLSTLGQSQCFSLHGAVGAQSLLPDPSRWFSVWPQCHGHFVPTSIRDGKMSASPATPLHVDSAPLP